MKKYDFPKFIGVGYDIEIKTIPFIPLTISKWGLKYYALRTKLNISTNMQEENIPLLRNLHGEVQGFVDQHGVFMDRKEALDVATAAGQINTRRPKNPGDWLCSEDLY